VYVTTTRVLVRDDLYRRRKEQFFIRLAVDRYYGRLVRYLEPLLESDRLSEIRRYPYPDAGPFLSPRPYRLAADRLVRTVSAEANSRKQERGSHQVAAARADVRYFARPAG